MSRPWHQSSYEKLSANSAHRPVMAYMCECGAKWTNPTKASFECKCGRQLVMRNGIIHADVVQPSWQIVSSQGASA